MAPMNSGHLRARITKYTAKSATDATRKPRVKQKRRYGMVRVMNSSGSPMDQRSRRMSPLKGPVRSRARRWARRRSISRTDRSRRVRSQRPIALSFSAKRSTAAALTLRPWSRRAPAASAAVRWPSSACMTAISTGRKRKYFLVAGSFTMKLCSPR